LGIGTTSPVARNHLKGSGTSGQVTASWILENASSGTAGMDITGSAGASRWRFLYGGGASTGTNTLTEAMCIGTEGSSAGNVGIGTSSPDIFSNGFAKNLGVAVTGSGATASINVSGGSGGAGRIQFGTETTRYGLVYVDASNFMQIATTTALPISFVINSTERARITSAGEWLVGTTTNAGTTVGSRMFPTGLIQGTRAESTDATTQFDLYSTGASAYRFYVGMGGTIFATSIVISAISDQRLKENVRDIDTGLDAIMALKPRRFDWKEGKGQDKKDVAGFIAQEFEDVFPECVSTSKAGADGIEYKNINHETLIPTLVKAMQEQQALITQLQADIATLKG
jgi:hypothetical protein